MPSAEQIALAVPVLGAFVWLIKQQGDIRRYIREAAGVRDTQDVHVTGGKLQTEPHVRLATFEELQVVERRVATIERKFDERMAGVEKKMDRDKQEIIKAGEERVVRIHDRIDKVAEALGELRGEIKGRFA